MQGNLNLFYQISISILNGQPEENKLWTTLQMQSYRTVWLAQTGICSGIPPMALRSTFINKCINDVVPTVTVRTYQKPWITGNIRSELKARAAAFKEQDSNPEASKKWCYALQRTIKQAKHQYRTKIESYYACSNANWMWQGLQTITDYKGKPSHWREPTRWAKCLICSLRGKQHWTMHEWDQLFRTTVWFRSP